VFNGTFSTNRLHCAIGVRNILCRARGQDNTLRPGLCRDNLLTTNRRPQSLSSQSLGKYWKLNQNNQETQHIQMQTNAMQKVALINNRKRTQMKKRLERRKHCVLAVVRRSQKNFRPAADPFPGAQDGQNLISWRWSLSSHTDPVWWRSMHAISSYHGNRATNKQDRLQYTAPLASVQCRKPALREETDRAWFSRLLRHLARKWSGSILLTPWSSGIRKGQKVMLQDWD